MQHILCDGKPISNLTTADLEEHLSRVDELEFNDTDGESLQSAREAVRRGIELELRIRNMGLRS